MARRGPKEMESGAGWDVLMVNLPTILQIETACLVWCSWRGFFRLAVWSQDGDVFAIETVRKPFWPYLGISERMLLCLCV